MPATPEPHWRQQIAAMDALIAVGGLARGSRRRTKKTSSLLTPSDPGTVPDFGYTQDDLRTSAEGVEWLAVPAWRELDWLWHGFSTRRGGVSRAYTAARGKGELNLGLTEEDDREAVFRNRRLLAHAVTGNPAMALIPIKQFHSSLVVSTRGADAQLDHPRRADGQITNEPGVLLAIQTADCIPVLVADRRRRAVGAFHAGWRGTVKRIVQSGVGRMRLEFGSRPEDLVAAIGPGIGRCCYAVGDEVRAAFASQFAYAPDLFHEVYDPDPVRLKYPMLFLNQRAPGHSEPLTSLHLDLVEANRRQLMDAGLSAERIHWIGGCTNCQTHRFFSHRGERGRTGRMMAVIGVREIGG